MKRVVRQKKLRAEMVFEVEVSQAGQG